jgi:hypothetical protein
LTTPGGPQAELFRWAGLRRLPYSNPSNLQSSKFEKYKSHTSRSSTISKLFRGIDTLKRNKFPFGKKLKFPIEFEIKIKETNPI